MKVGVLDSLEPGTSVKVRLQATIAFGEVRYCRRLAVHITPEFNFTTPGRCDLGKVVAGLPSPRRSAWSAAYMGNAETAAAVTAARSGSKLDPLL